MIEETDRTITPDIDDKQYFALPSIDQSQLKEYLHNPYDWAWKRLSGEHKTTTAFEFGTAFHAFLLGTSHVVNLPEGETLRSKDNRDWKAEHEAEGDIVVSYDTMRLLERMRGNIERASRMGDCPNYMKIIEDGIPEQCIEWTDQESGLRLKAKPDLIPANETYLVDLKTCRSISQRDFAVTVLNHGYHIQAEFYRMAVAQVNPALFNRQTRRASSMDFWCFEKEGACDWFPHRFGARDEMAEKARQSIRQGLNRLSVDCRKAEDAGYGTGPDAAAKWILDTHHPIKPVNIVFEQWMVDQAGKLV